MLCTGREQGHGPIWLCVIPAEVFLSLQQAQPLSNANTLVIILSADLGLKS